MALGVQPQIGSHAAALATGAAAGLDAAARALDTLGAALLAAEAYTAAAAAYQSDGLPRPATAATQRAAQLAAACGNPQTPGLAAAPASGRLTRREREVAALAAAGASSRQIAGRLVLSVRTVDSDLHSAYASSASPAAANSPACCAPDPARPGAPRSRTWARGNARPHPGPGRAGPARRYLGSAPRQK